MSDIREQIIDPHHRLSDDFACCEGVVNRGTGYSVSKVGKPLAGKTGTSNDEKDAWFVGFSPDLVAGVFIGYDNPTPMGKGETGGHIAAPIFRDFMKLALADKPATPFRSRRRHQAGDGERQDRRARGSPATRGHSRSVQAERGAAGAAESYVHLSRRGRLTIQGDRRGLARRRQAHSESRRAAARSAAAVMPPAPGTAWRPVLERLSPVVMS